MLQSGATGARVVRGSLFRGCRLCSSSQQGGGSQAMGSRSESIKVCMGMPEGEGRTVGAGDAGTLPRAGPRMSSRPGEARSVTEKERSKKVPSEATASMG